MEAVDSYVPTPERDMDKPFLMPIEDVFTITGRGTVVTGRVERGKLPINSEVETSASANLRRPPLPVSRCSTSRWTRHGQARTVVCSCAAPSDEVERGQVVAVPGSITPHTNFTGQVYILKKEEGGRQPTPSSPTTVLSSTSVPLTSTGIITLPEGTDMVMPGDTTEISVELIQPIAMEPGLGFAIREGGRTVGSGRVTEITK